MSSLNANGSAGRRSPDLTDAGVRAVGVQHSQRDAPRGEEFTSATVPEGKTVSGLSIGLVLVGISITIPAFLTGSQLGLGLGVTNAALAVLAGSVALCLIASVAAIIAARSRLTTYMIIQFPFGSKGAKLVNAVISVTIFGWFTVTAAFFGESIQHVVREAWQADVALAWLIVGGSVLVTATTVFGFGAIDKLSQLTVPLLCAALGYLVYLVLQDATLPQLRSYQPTEMPLGRGITAVIGSYIVAAVILPDYCRFVRSTQGGVFAAVLNFGIAYPVLLFVFAVVSIYSGGRNFIEILIGMGLGLAGVLLILFATWTTNIGNLYSNSLVLKTIFTDVPLRLIVVVAGIVGTLLAVTGITQYFIEFLVLLGITLPPVAGIYMADYFFVRNCSYRLEVLLQQPPVAYPVFAIWLIASATAYMTSSGWFTLTSIPACDSVLLAFLLYYAHHKLTSRRQEIS